MLNYKQNLFCFTILLCLHSFLFPATTRADDIVRVSGRIMKYNQALSQLTKMLDGDTGQKLEAMESLLYYGDTLLGTEAMDKIFKIASATNTFSLMDDLLNLPPEKQQEYRKKPLSDAAKAEAKLFNLKLFALSIIINSGADKEGVLLKRYSESSSATERYMLQSVHGVIKFSWESGRMHSKAKKPDLKKLLDEEKKTKEGKGAIGGSVVPNIVRSSQQTTNQNVLWSPQIPGSGKTNDLENPVKP